MNFGAGSGAKRSRAVGSISDEEASLDEGIIRGIRLRGRMGVVVTWGVDLRLVPTPTLVAGVRASQGARFTLGNGSADCGLAAIAERLEAR